MHTYALLGKIVTRDAVIEDGALIVEGARIAWVGARQDACLPQDVRRVQGRLIAPGFVDIHCHIGNDFLETDEDDEVILKWMMANGATGILYTLFGSISHERVMELLPLIRARMETYPAVLGVHMEGPYTNPALGSGLFDKPLLAAVPAEYREVIESGLVRMWTYAPEVPGTDVFLEEIKRAGIVPALGHSAISAQEVMALAPRGIEVFTHLFDATGDAPPTKYVGTRELSFDQGAMLCDNAYYEIICDRHGAHVRPDMIRLLIKTVGIERVVGITDFVRREPNGEDVSFVYNKGQPVLDGSAMNMLRAARNFRALGLSLPQLFRVVSYNPACAIHVEREMGSLEAGKYANIILVDEAFTVVETILHGVPVAD